ncbi:hypothetical protein SKAU_G00058810 [Synaphobranchus kaupii]|uniref:Uncharacterized protein n=1 Tax=Synaphobranchus kaupii TaxID=118154 RepID=A0A9Q1J9E0_SYNKA|nr:hypothetical protein SKAU_G00058810 [Synaphobranchus kaupii]
MSAYDAWTNQINNKEPRPLRWYSGKELRIQRLLQQMGSCSASMTWSPPMASITGPIILSDLVQMEQVSTLDAGRASSPSCIRVSKQHKELNLLAEVLEEPVLKPTRVDGTRGKEKLAVKKRQAMATGGGPQSTQDLTTAEEVASSTLTPLSVDGFGGLEVGLSVSSEPEAETELTQPRSIPPRQSAPRRRRSGDDQQRNGFTMLERELRGIRVAIGSLNTRLIRMEHMRLNMSNTLLRLAVAVE